MCVCLGGGGGGGGGGEGELGGGRLLYVKPRLKRSAVHGKGTLSFLELGAVSSF